MLATSASALPSGPGWGYEFKWDGVRVLLDSREGRVRLTSRAENDVTAAYPELHGPPGDGTDVLLDGEVVAFVAGRPSFEALQSRMHLRVAAEARRLALAAPVTFVVFDLLRLDGESLLDRPQRDRRDTLERWAQGTGLTVSPVFDDPDATTAVAGASGLEGVMAKRLASPYRPGVRSRDWVKRRFVRTGDFVVVGWEAAPETPDRLSSLLLAVAAPEGPTFAGRVGSGLTGRTATSLTRRLRERPSSPLGEPGAAAGPRPTHWVEPDLVVEVEFTAWTGEGRLRHPVLRRVREDKTAEEATGDA